MNPSSATSIGFAQLNWQLISPILQIVVNWQTLITGILVLLAAWLIIRTIIQSANRQIRAAAQLTEMARRQIETSVLTDRARHAREMQAYIEAAHAAAQVVLARVGTARLKILPRSVDPLPMSKEAYEGRQSLICSILIDLRPACVKFGGEIAHLVILLDAYIISVTNEWTAALSAGGLNYRVSPEAGFREVLDLIEQRAENLLAVAKNALTKNENEISEIDQGLREMG